MTILFGTAIFKIRKIDLVKKSKQQYRTKSH